MVKGRILAVDVGARRVGLAISDVSGTLARPLETIAVTSDAEAVHRVARRIADHSRCDKAFANGQTANALRELDELRRGLVPAIGLVDTPIHEGRRAGGDEQQQKQNAKHLLHAVQSVHEPLG